MILGDDEAEYWLVHFTLAEMLKFCLKYPIGQLSKVSASTLPSPSTIIKAACTVEVHQMTPEDKKIKKQLTTWWWRHRRQWRHHGIFHFCTSLLTLLDSPTGAFMRSYYIQIPDLPLNTYLCEYFDVHFSPIFMQWNNMDFVSYWHVNIIFVSK